MEKVKTRKQIGVEIWSRGKASTWMKGLGFYENSTGRFWELIEPYYQSSLCLVNFIKTGKFYDIDVYKFLLKAYVKALNETSVLLFDPLLPLSVFSSDRNWKQEIIDGYAMFLKEYPVCGSKSFNGALILNGSEISKGIATAIDINRMVGGVDSTTILLKQSRVLVTICHHLGPHLIGKDKKLLELFANVCKREIDVEPIVA